MSRPAATLRILDTLPLSLTPDSDPRVIDDEVVVPRPDRKAYAVTAHVGCPECRGHGMITEIVTEPGKDPQRNLRPCSCVWLAIGRAERGEKVTGATARSVQSPETALDRARRRVARIEAELAAAEAAEVAIVKAREEKIAPFVARVSEAESAAEHAILHDAACRGAVADSRRLADEAQATFRQAQESLQAALVAYEQAQNLAEASTKRLTPLARAIDAAKDDLRRASNCGGERHRLQVAQKRIADMQVRLRCAREDAAKLEPAEETEALPC